ncbi:MAG: rod shape-determining protein MreC, partial [Sphingomonas bacterium]|nr:rod shape-determining protein MreC [Sphingomonas bacterium]
MMAPSRNRRPGFSRRAQYSLFLGYVIAVAGSLVGAVLLALATLDPPAFAALRASMGEVTTPVSSGVSWVGRGITSIPSGINGYIAVHDKNVALQKQIDDMHALLMRARSLSYENRRLKALVQMREHTAGPV